MIRTRFFPFLTVESIRLAREEHLRSYTAIMNWLEGLTVSPRNYYFSFIADSALGLFFIGQALYAQSVHPTLPWAGLPLAFLVGNMVQSFSEYFFHRWVFHRLFGELKNGHRLHHQEPKSLLAMPWFADILLISSFWAFFFLVSAGDLVFAGMAGGGVVFRYVQYGLIHHTFHHFEWRNRTWRKMRAYHYIHHRLPDRNFGVSGRFWDWVLGTHYQGERYRT